jgi:hypothetical protein
MQRQRAALKHRAVQPNKEAHVKRRLMLGAVALAAVGLIAAFATTAYARPTRTTSCGNCHSGPSLTVGASETANNGTTATYDVSAPGADYIAVFDGSAKIDQITGASGSISVAVGKTYVLQAVAGPIETDGWGSRAISPVAPEPTPDTIAPVTTSNALATYVGSASIHLTATDNEGGSGVAATYYLLDGEPRASGTDVAVSTIGDHTLTFWSVDAAGNVEQQNSVSFSITAPTPDATGTASVRVHVMAATGRGVAGAMVTLTNTGTGSTVTVKADRHGFVTFKKLAAGTYTASVTLSNGHTLTSTFKLTHHRKTITLKDHRHRPHRSSHSSSRRD